ncbi:MAG: tetratricopeptide repeat protein [Mucilaginibacter sp.]
MLKQVLYIFIAFVIPSLCFGNEGVSALFKSGNNSYNKGQYKEALTAYQKVIGSGYESAALYYNMGNACYKTGDIPSALLYYGKAHKLSPGDEDINFNIRFVNLRTTDKIDEAPEFFPTRWWKGFILGISANSLALLSILFVLLASSLLIIYFFTTSVSVKRSSFYSAVILFIIGAFVVFIAGMQVSYFKGHREAIIFSSSVTVKSGPVDKAAALFVIHDGARVNVLDDSNGWLKIRLANGNEGWIKAGDAKEI